MMIMMMMIIIIIIIIIIVTIITTNVPVRPLKTCRGIRFIAPLTLNLGARWRSVFGFIPRRLYSWKKLIISLIGVWVPPEPIGNFFLRK